MNTSLQIADGICGRKAETPEVLKDGVQTVQAVAEPRSSSAQVQSADCKLKDFGYPSGTLRRSLGQSRSTLLRMPTCHRAPMDVSASFISIPSTPSTTRRLIRSAVSRSDQAHSFDPCRQPMPCDTPEPTDAGRLTFRQGGADIPAGTHRAAQASRHGRAGTRPSPANGARRSGETRGPRHNPAEERV